MVSTACCFVVRVAAKDLSRGEKGKGGNVLKQRDIRRLDRERTVPEGSRQEVVSGGSGEAGGPALDGQDPAGQTGREPGNITPQLHPTVTAGMKPHSAKGRHKRDRQRELKEQESCVRDTLMKNSQTIPQFPAHTICSTNKHPRNAQK